MRVTAVFCLLLFPCLNGVSLAQTTPTAPTNMSADINRAIEGFLLKQAAGYKGQARVETGPLPSTEKYTACKAWQAFLPQGAQAWGNVSVGVRCVAGGSFSFYARARVIISGTYLVAARAIPLGQTVQPEDLKAVQGELTAQAPDLLMDADQVVGRVARTSIPPERPLQAILFRQEALVQAGQPVKVVSGGDGFSVSNDGQAITSGVQGQTIRIRMPGGNIVSGIVRARNVVEISH